MPKPDKRISMWEGTRLLARVAAIAVGLTILSIAPLHAQQIVGRLLDSESGEPVAGAAVDLLTLDSVPVTRTLTNASGAYLLTAPTEGSYRVRTQHLGYVSATSPIVSVGEGERTVLELRLAVAAIALQGVTAVGVIERRPGELGGFYDRREANVYGRFISRDEFERWNSTRFTDILAMSGVRVDRNFRPNFPGADCVSYVIDGVRIPQSYTDPGIDAIVNVQDVEAVELYRFAAHVPIEFAGSFNRCGAIFIWTRYSR